MSASRLAELCWLMCFSYHLVLGINKLLKGESMKYVASKIKNQKFKEVPIEELRKLFQYNPNTGELLQNSRKINTALSEDDNFSVWFYVKKENKKVQYKVTAVELVYALQTGKFSTYKVRTRDLDNSNLKFNNLFEVQYEQEKIIRTALLNLRKYLKCNPTDFDQNKFIVQVYNETVINRRFDCIEAATAYIRKTKLAFMKSLERVGIDINSKLLY